MKAMGVKTDVLKHALLAGHTMQQSEGVTTKCTVCSAEFQDAGANETNPLWERGSEMVEMDTADAEKIFSQCQK